MSLQAENPNQSYHELLTNIRTILQQKYTQIPQLSSSHPIVSPLMNAMFQLADVNQDTDLEFII